MALLDWMMGRQPEKAAGAPEGVRPNGRFKEVGEPFKSGDRIVVYEPYHSGRDPKRPPFAPGIVDSVYHKGTLVSYERVGRPAGNAPIEDVRHATKSDAEKYAKDFAAIEMKRQRAGRLPSMER